MKETRRVNYGYIAIRKLWNKFSLTNLLTGLVRRRKIEFNFAEIVFSLVVNRLLNPSSKLYHYQHRDKYFNQNDNVQLHQFYRTLDILAENKEAIEEALFEKNRNLFNMKIDVVFYDITTYHFEAQLSDDLRDFGFSKANKIDEVQVVMGLLIDIEGRPIGYELFPGNTFEGKTMLKVLEKLRKKFMLENVIIVADKGLNSKLNLLDIKYHSLYKIEESFRILKSTMQTRPVYLRTKEHIEGHFVMCFLAFLLERDLELSLRQKSIYYSSERIKEALNMMEFSEVKIENDNFYLKGKHNSLAAKIFSTLRIKQPSSILASEDAVNYASQ